MSRPRLIWLVSMVLVLGCLRAQASEEDNANTAEALALARTRLLQLFPFRDGAIIARKKRGVSNLVDSEDTSLFLFRDFRPLVQDDRRERTGEVTWNGSIEWQMTGYRQLVDTRVPNFPDLGSISAKSWESGGNRFLTVYLVKKNGHWSYSQPEYSDFVAPNAADLKDVARSTPDLAGEEKTSSQTMQATFERGALGYYSAVRDLVQAPTMHEQLVLPFLPPAKVQAAGNADNIALVLGEENPWIKARDTWPFHIELTITAGLDDPACAVGIIRLSAQKYAGGAVTTVLIGYTDTGGFQWWFGGTSAREQAFLRAASKGKLGDGPIAVQDGESWTLTLNHERLDPVVVAKTVAEPAPAAPEPSASVEPLRADPPFKRLEDDQAASPRTSSVAHTARRTVASQSQPVSAKHGWLTSFLASIRAAVKVVCGWLLKVLMVAIGLLIMFVTLVAEVSAPLRRLLGSLGSSVGNGGYYQRQEPTGNGGYYQQDEPVRSGSYSHTSDQPPRPAYHSEPNHPAHEPYRARPFTQSAPPPAPARQPGYTCKFCGHLAQAPHAGHCVAAPGKRHEFIVCKERYCCTFCGHVSQRPHAAHCVASPHRYHEFI